MMIPSRIDPAADAAAMIGHQFLGGLSAASAGFGSGGLGLIGRSDGSVSLNSIRLSHATPSVPAFEADFFATGGGAGAAKPVAGGVVAVGAGATGGTAGGGSGIGAGCVPGLKNFVSACATSPGVWNRFAGSLAIIFATSAASSVGTSGRTRLSGWASIEWWAWSSSYRLVARNGARPLRR